MKAHSLFGAGLVAILAACASPGPPPCRIQVTGLEEYSVRPGDVTIAYRVQGDAAGEGEVWLAARAADGSWVSGSALEVGPGEFGAIVDLRLTGKAERYKVVLAVGEHRCADEAPAPDA